MEKLMQIRNLKVGAFSVEITAKNVPLKLTRQDLHKSIKDYDVKCLRQTFVESSIISIAGGIGFGITGGLGCAFAGTAFSIIRVFKGIEQLSESLRATKMIKNNDNEVVVRDIDTTQVFTLTK